MTAPVDTATPVMELTGVSKRFDATQALDGVSLTLHPGETHACSARTGRGSRP
jgi:ribose transport system ATP-binding protein